MYIPMELAIHRNESLLMWEPCAAVLALNPKAQHNPIPRPQTMQLLLCAVWKRSNTLPHMSITKINGKPFATRKRLPFLLLLF